MTMKRLVSLAAASVLVLGLASLATAGIPDETLSTASSAAGCLAIVPDGNGDTLGGKGLTVTVTVLDTNGSPIAGYPFQDTTLVSATPGDVAVCPGGWTAAANTNASGVTTISGTGAGGGYATSMQVALAGVRLTGAALSIEVRSPDMNGDLAVSLLDLSDPSIGFATLFLNGSPDARSDYNCDGAENLLDVSAFAIANGAVCP